MSPKTLHALVLVAFLALLCTPSQARAQDVFRATLDKTNIFLGETVTLKVEINIGKKWYGSLRLPRFRRTKIRKRTKKKLREALFVGGRSQVRYIWRITHVLKPRKAGIFRSSAGKLWIGRKKLVIKPMTIVVKKGKPIPKQNVDRLPAYIKARGDVFIYPVLSPKTVYADQQATISYYLFRRRSVHIDRPQLPRLADFWKEPLVPIHPLSDWRIRHLQGKRYSYTLVLRYAIFPMRQGTLNVDGLSFRIKRSFAGPAAQGKLVQSPTVKLKVSALPSSVGKGVAVGRYKLSAQFLQQRFRTREPITYQLKIEGVGNLRQLSAPTLSFPSKSRIKVVSTRAETTIKPERGQVKGSRRFTYILRAEKPGRFQAPAIPFTFFDPWQKQRQTLRTERLPFRVLAGPKHLMAILKKRKTSAGKGLPQIKLKAPGQQGSNEEGRSLLWLLLPLPLLGVGAWFALRRRTPKDPMAEAKEAAAAAAQQQGQCEYQEAAQSLQEWQRRHQSTAPDATALTALNADINKMLQAWLGTPVGHLSRKELLRTIDQQQAPDLFIQVLRGLFQHIDQARFSPIATHSNLSQLVQQLLQHQPPPR